MPRPKLDNAKNTRCTLLIPESTRDKIKKIAYIQQKSFNALCCEVLDNYISKHSAELKKYSTNFEGEQSPT